MNHTVGVLLLGGCCVAGLALVPLGLPGLWLMLAAVVGYGWLTGFHAIGLVTIAVVLGLALLGNCSSCGSATGSPGVTADRRAPGGAPCSAASPAP